MLPTLLPVLLAALSLSACDSTPPPQQQAEVKSNQYREALQEAEAMKHSVEERQLEQQRIDRLLGRTPPGNN